MSIFKILSRIEVHLLTEVTDFNCFDSLHFLWKSLCTLLRIKLLELYPEGLEQSNFFICFMAAASYFSLRMSVTSFVDFPLKSSVQSMVESSDMRSSQSLSVAFIRSYWGIDVVYKFSFFSTFIGSDQIVVLMRHREWSENNTFSSISWSTIMSRSLVKNKSNRFLFLVEPSSIWWR